MVPHPHDNFALPTLVNQLVTELGDNANESMIILRNGGPEGWVRNRLLIAGEAHNHWGFAEAYYQGIPRVDLLFRCSVCPIGDTPPTIAVEIKTNFSNQQTEINKRISDAIDQLSGFLELEVPIPAYLVYFVTDLRADQNLPFVLAHNTVTPGYKHFSHNQQWPNGGLGVLPENNFCGNALVHLEGAVAEVRAWTALVQGDGNDQRCLSFVNAKGEVHCVQFRRENLQPGERPRRVARRWKWVPVQG